MIAHAELISLGGAISAVGVIVLLQSLRSKRQLGARAAPTNSDRADTPWPEPTLSVLSYSELVQSTGTAGALARAQADSGLNTATWAEWIDPVLRSVAELVQLLPASEAHHHAQPGGLWIHTCETLNFAIRYRDAFVLPPAHEADDVAKLKHIWTAGVIVGALLHDVGKTETDFRIRLYGPDCDGASWSAMAGTMQAAGATHYAVDFPREQERDYRAHQRLGGILLQRLVPPKALRRISTDRMLLKSLLQYLLNEATADNPIAKIVSHAEVESVRANLMNGPRTRFASARAVPLIERLMDALRRMLAEGGKLPLNRPGAAGYVFNGEIWFAAARLANAVRDYLVEHESAAGIPGEDKNDRLFDAWQDYGACQTNPDSGRAIFGGRIEFATGASYDLPAMLRFPLHRLYRDESQYPASMPGRIGLMTAGGDDSSSETCGADRADATVGAAESSLPAQPGQAKGDAESGRADATAQKAPPAPPQAPNAKARQSDQARASGGFLAPDDMASMEQMTSAPPAKAAALAPVAPSLELPNKSKSGKPPPERAIEFMQWVQSKVADGTLPYNAAGAMVHFVRHADSVALLLVSPIIFRRFEEDIGESQSSPGLTTQRAFSGAGWHLRGPNGRNIWSYQIMRTGAKSGNLLNGFLLLEPERFFSPVPPANERMIAWNTAPLSKREKVS